MRPKGGRGPHRAVSATVIFSAVMFVLLALLSANASALNTTQADVDFVAAGTDDAPPSVDPGYTKDVAGCVSQVVSDELVVITLQNGYPSYTCTFTVTIQNSGMLPVKLAPLDIDAPPVLTVAEVGGHAGIVLEGGRRDTETFTVHVEQTAAQGAEYTFEIRKRFDLHATGTIGFWRNWDRHRTFSQSEIEGWLVQIDASSSWFGPTTTSGMVSVMEAALKGNAKPKDKFLGHCLATRLNERSGILDGTDVHDVRGEDPANFLGLADPSAATLNQIIAAIEGKYGTPLNNTRYNIMKDVCDALNNLEV